MIASQAKPCRIIGLDLVRIALTLLIFLFHSRIHLGCNYYTLNAFINNGHLVGMTGFFLLSGFCLQLSNGSREFSDFSVTKQYYWKRIISIYPLYIFTGCLFVAILILIREQSLGDNLLLLPVELLCIQSFFDSLFEFSHNSGTWFISCLTLCYLLFPFLSMITRELKKKSVFAIILLLVFIHPFLFTFYCHPFWNFR